MEMPIVTESINWVSNLTSKKLDAQKAQPALCFLLFWGMLEHECVTGKDSLGIKRLFKLANDIVNVLDTESVNASFLFFKKRYLEDPKKPKRFENLRLAESCQSFLGGYSDKNFVDAILNQQDPTNEHKLACLLFIIHRFRNNLFHGNKNATVFHEFFNEFTEINSLLKLIIEKLFNKEGMLVTN